MRHTYKVIALAFALVALPFPASAQWSGPTQSPPNGNAATPLNITSTAQTKAGGLLLNSGGAANGLIVQLGNSGFATTAPSARLSVTGAGTGTGRALAVANSSNADKLVVLDNGNVAINKSSPGYTLDVNGNIGATAYFYTSDRSLKAEISPLEGALSKILSLQGVSFSWKKDGKRSVGLIAQDVENVFPELVGEAHGTKSVQYANLVAPLIEAIREQQRQIDELREEVEALKNNR